MKTLGWILLVVGVICLIAAMNMDVSVATGYGRVNNIGLMASRQNYIIVGAFITLCGLLMTIFGRGKTVDDGIRVKCPFCAELISSEAIKCKHCGSDVKDALDAERIKNFQPKDIPVSDFFIRRKEGFDINEKAIDSLVSQMKEANPNIHPMDIEERYRSQIEELKNQMPSVVRESFMLAYRDKL